MMNLIAENEEMYEIRVCEETVEFFFRVQNQKPFLFVLCFFSLLLCVLVFSILNFTRYILFSVVQPGSVCATRYF